MIRETKTNLMHYLSSFYFVNQPLHVSGIFVAHHQEVNCKHVYVQQFVRVVPKCIGMHGQQNKKKKTTYR